VEEIDVERIVDDMDIPMGIPSVATSGSSASSTERTGPHSVTSATPPDSVENSSSETSPHTTTPKAPAIRNTDSSAGGHQVVEFNKRYSSLECADPAGNAEYSVP
jgi:hypothetical protein